METKESDANAVTKVSVLSMLVHVMQQSLHGLYSASWQSECMHEYASSTDTHTEAHADQMRQ